MAFSGEQFYQNAIDEYNKKARTDLAQQTAQANANTQGQLQQAYIQRMQNQQQLKNNLQSQGIRGGMSETANLNLMNTYNANRNAIQSDGSNQITQLTTNANDNMFNYAQQMNTAQAEYRQNMLPEYYNVKYSKMYKVKNLKKALETEGLSAEEEMAINNRLAYLRAHKKGY